MNHALERAPVLTNVRWLAAANLAVRPVWFLFLLVSSRLLGPVEFGRTMFAVSFVTLVGVLFEGGVDVLVVRRLARSGSIRPPGPLQPLPLAGAAILAVTAASPAVLTGGGPRSPSRPSTAFNSPAPFRAVFRAFEVLKYEAISVLVEKIGVTLICGAVLLVSRESGPFLTAYALAYGVGVVFTLVLLVRRLGLPAWRIDTRFLWGEVLRPALPFALMNVFIMVYFRSGTFSWGPSPVRRAGGLLQRGPAGRVLHAAAWCGGAPAGFPGASRVGRVRPRLQATRAILLSQCWSRFHFVFHQSFTALLFRTPTRRRPVVGAPRP
jgi:hypothetical protein